MGKKQALNPYLPINEYIPDGEPHVFGDRIYIYGSHDREAGERFCELDYRVYSAPVNNLADWRDEGIAYSKEQDPSYPDEGTDMYAPDVVRGNDGRYYLYYALSGKSFTTPIHVAVSDSPSGKFEYYGCVRNEDGSDFMEGLTFDPAVLNDNGKIYMYYGWSLALSREQIENQNEEFKEKMVKVESMLFGKTEEEIRNTPNGVMGANVVELDDDMLTVKVRPKRIVPGCVDALNTDFENHAFFEASSIRKIDNIYYFIYSSQWMHELCYATSKYPDKKFKYGGVIISNGDIGYKGRKAKDRVSLTGNNHGSIEFVNGQWYIFYHRHTHKTSYSRQGCAEKIKIDENGKIAQVEMTSCGLNKGPIEAKGKISSFYACNITNGHMPTIERDTVEEEIPFLTNEGKDHYITDISDGTIIGFKYFNFNGNTKIRITTRGSGTGKFQVYTDEEMVGEIQVQESNDWTSTQITIDVKGEKSLYFKYCGMGKKDLLEIEF